MENDDPGLRNLPPCRLSAVKLLDFQVLRMQLVPHFSVS